MEVPDSIKFVTCQNCKTHLRVVRTEKAHFTQNVPKVDPDLEATPVPPVASEVDWKEVEALDQKWNSDLKDLVYTDGSIPTETDAMSAIIISIFLGVLALFIGTAFGLFGFLFGLMIFLITIGNARHKVKMTKDFLTAQDAYQTERKRLVGQASHLSQN